MQLRISKRYPSLVPTNMLFERSKEFFVETDVRDGQRAVASGVISLG